MQLVALDVVARIASGMNKPFEKQTRFFAFPVATVLSDQKTHIRAAAIQTLTAMAEACEGLDAMAHHLTAAFESPNPLQKSSLLNWIADWCKDHPPSASLDITEWVPPVVACLEDRSGDVRKSAQAVLPIIVGRVGYDRVISQTNSLKPAARAVVVPLIKAAAAAAAPVVSSEPASPAKAAPANTKSTPATKPSAPSPTPSDEPPPTPAPGPSKLNGVRRKLPQAGGSRPESRASVNDDAPQPSSRLAGKAGAAGLKRPGSVNVSARPPSASPAATASAPFITMNLDAKKSRLAKDGVRWVVESGPTRKDLLEQLQLQMEAHASKELFTLLFSHDHNAVADHVTGQAILCDFFSSLASGEDKYGFTPQERQTIGLANADFALKYVSIHVHEPQPNLISKCLDVVDNVMAFLRDINHQLSDPEAMAFVPTIIYKVRIISALFNHHF